MFPFDLSKTLPDFYRASINNMTRAVYRPTYIGFENIPETGAAVIVSNHVSYMDGPIIDAGCKRMARYIIDEDIFNTPGVHYLMSMAQAIPISTNRKSIERAMDIVSEGLKNGDLICIFPEGYLTFTGGLGRFRPGIEWIIKRDPVPVIPIALSGLWGSVFSRKYLKQGPMRWVPHHYLDRVVAKCGEPIPPEKVTVNYLQDVVLKLKYSI